MGTLATGTILYSFKTVISVLYKQQNPTLLNLPCLLSIALLHLMH